MSNYIAMSKKTHDKYNIYTNFAVTATFNLESFGIDGINEDDHLMMKINNELDENIVIIRHNDNIYSLTIHELIDCIVKKDIEKED